MYKKVLTLFCLLLITGSLSAQQPSTQRHRVAVLDFSYGTVMTSSQAIFGTNVDVGKGISDLLIDKLTNDGTYRIIERNEINKIINEQNFSNSNRADASTAAKIGHILGVDAVITGDITQFGRDDEHRNYGGMLGRWGKGAGLGDVGTSKAKAVVAVTARMVDVNTGEILASATGRGESSRSGTNLLGGGANNSGVGGGDVSMGSSNFGQTIIGEAVTAAVAQLAQSLAADSDKLPTAAAVAVSGLIADASTSDVIINVGSSAGLKVGDKLIVSHPVRVIKDPTTGKPLRTIENQLGQLTITSVDANSAVGSFSGSGKPQIGDTVKTQ
ncbi:CsgG/HfaB family protein [Paracidobacterium acidisoli]|uniref:Curli production assembly protein CsgG n=1 Tax=Paracidobacterium acidisoli TaxID=2303751 RepID=A0A372IRD4_9BACT|nr:CsgG/HfaB family protein [Paracidobacterium acidisoli]MBT9330190.1 curli production assembly protein CsgG [Paracidobacterium acidisoli]